MKTFHESFAEKYRAKKFTEIIEQEKAIEAIQKFLKEFPKKKGLLLYGPAGTGKTTLALTAVRENNFDVLELNSSDLRNRAKLEETLKPASQQASLFKRGKIILMDEVDGVTGTDIGGISELVRVLETSKHPIIMTCNDAWQSKLSPVRKLSVLVEMKSLPLDKIKSFLKKVAASEGIVKDEKFFNHLTIKSQGDLRAALNDLQSYSHAESLPVNIEEKRDIEENIFNLLRRLFKERQDFLSLFDSTSLSLDEVLLWIEENLPKEYRNEALAKAYYALGNADIFRGRIYKNQHWRFLLYQNIFQSAGISYAKHSPLSGFTKYEPPKRILKIWQNNQRTEKKKSIAKKLARYTHCSYDKVLSEFPIFQNILKNEKIQKELKLGEEELIFLNKQ